MPTDQYITKADMDTAFEEFYVRIEKMVGQVVGEIIDEALQLISERFDKLEARMDHFEDKLDQLSATVSQHSIAIRKLQRKNA
jgi:ABC-type phosphate transport system auxiliary subunit